VPVRVGLVLPPLYARALTPEEFTFCVEQALCEGEANAKLQALLDAAIETKIANGVGLAAAG
jgi:hypothetical protein